MALEIMKNGLAKNKIRGPFRPMGEGGQDEMVPGPFQNTFLFSNPSLNLVTFFRFGMEVHMDCENKLQMNKKYKSTH